MSCPAGPVGTICSEWLGQETGHNTGTGQSNVGRSGEIDRRVGKTGRNISAAVELTCRAALRYVQ